MIDATNHIELDGVKYRLAEDAEGQHYLFHGETLRPPNAVTVQGEKSQEFQPRPDILLWNWSDWSDGEGRRKLKFGEAGRSWQLNAVRAFEEPGHLIPGYYVETTQDSTGAADITLSLTLVVGIDKLYGLDRNAANVYLWDAAADKWGAAVALTGVTAGANDTAVGDNDAIYWIERSTNNVWKWTGTGAPTKISDTDIDATATTHIAQLGAYVYVLEATTATVWEIPKSGAAGVKIDDWSEVGATPAGLTDITVLDGRIYFTVTQRSETAVREVTPTTAAGTGFGAEIARIHGLKTESLWAHSGALYLLGTHEDTAINRTVIYLTPDGDNYGTLGQIRDGDTMRRGSGAGTRMLDHFWGQAQLDSASTNHALMQIDSVSGGVACLAYDADAGATDFPASVTAYNGDIFWSTIVGTATKRVLRARSNRYMVLSNAISPEHDFDLASAKFLSSLVLSCEALPADWTIYVDYQTDNSGSWTTGITYTTDSGTGETQVITTSGTTVEFNTLQLRIRFAYTGGGVPTSAPVVLGVEARAGVAVKVPVFQLLLDLADDQSGGGQSRAGASKATAFEATAVKTTAVAFKNGYKNRQTGVFSTHSVMVDTYDVLLSKAGEGVGQVTLKEVV